MSIINEKPTYCTPQIERVKLDNEISLVLVSGNPGDPYGSVMNSASPEYFNINPIKDNIG